MQSGLHAPTHPLLFREFCEFLVRLAAARYRSLPGLERRLHTLINAHLLHQVGVAGGAQQGGMGASAWWWHSMRACPRDPTREPALTL